MKKRIVFMLFFLALGLQKSFLSAEALTTNSAPYTTYTIGPNGRYVQTQTAYEPAGELSIDLALNNPEDMMVFGDYVYVADTGNARIVKYSLADGHGDVIIDGLNQPTGLHIDENGRIYVADKGDRTVYLYDENGVLLQTFDRPTEPIFGETSPFVPLKIATGPRGILYVVGEGSTAGLMQLNYAGEFLGFFASNITSLSWLQVVANFFGVSRALNIPTSPSNVTLDDKGSVYTVSNLTGGQIKKFNIASQAILTMSSGSNPIAIHINDFGNIFTIATDGLISEYDSYGNLIFAFGGLDQGNLISGLFVNPVDIASDEDHNLFILDKGTDSIHYLQRSEFARIVHDGLIDFKNGVYSIEQWQEVLRMNSLFALANAVIARGYYRLQNYGEALYYYLFAFDRIGYSEAFWQLRYQWMELNLSYVFILLIGFFLLVQAMTWAQNRYKLFQWAIDIKTNIQEQTLVRQLRLTQRMVGHPLDTYQDIKFANKSSLLAAAMIYLAVLVVSLLEVYGTGFIFAQYDVNTFNVWLYSAMVLGGILTFVFSNYLVATISDGEGWFKDILISTSYALTPYLAITPIMILLSHVLTGNELIVYQILDGLRYGWSAILVVLMIKEIHNFDLKALAKNILLTAFTMVLLVLVAFLLYVLTSQVFNFIEGVIREVMLRA